MKKYAEIHKEEKKAYYKEYREKFGDEIRKREEKRRREKGIGPRIKSSEEELKKREKERAKIYYENNREKCIEYYRKYYQENKKEQLLQKYID